VTPDTAPPSAPADTACRQAGIAKTVGWILESQRPAAGALRKPFPY